MNRLVGVLALLALPAQALANVGAPTHGGTPAGEPGGIADVAVVHEELAIDLRALVDGGSVAVDARYHLANQGGERTLDLVFASGAREHQSFHVTLDGQPLATTDVSPTSLPTSWMPPKSTPLPDGGELWFELGEHELAAAGFQAHLTPGPHELAITYTAEAVTHHAGQPVVLYQFAYVLAPARSWSAFGGLDVTVHAPPGWNVTARPLLARTGDTLNASFAQLPADAIGLTASAPLGRYPLVRIAMLIVVVLVGLAGAVAVYLFAARRARERARLGLAPAHAAAAFWLGLGWAIVFEVVAIASITVPDHALPAAQIDHRGYAALGLGILYTLIAMGMVMAGLVIGIVAGRRATPRPRS